MFFWAFSRLILGLGAVLGVLLFLVVYALIWAYIDVLFLVAGAGFAICFLVCKSDFYLLLLGCINMIFSGQFSVSRYLFY